MGLQKLITVLDMRNGKNKVLIKSKSLKGGV
jgi:hypothetical protein